MGTGSSSQGGLVTDINVTPLVDVVLVLLVILMVTATAVANRTIALDLPKTSAGSAEGAAQQLVVAVDETGALYLGMDLATDQQVRERARALAAADPNASVVLAAAAMARHQAVVHAIELLRAEHVSKIAIVVKGTGGP